MSKHPRAPRPGLAAWIERIRGQEMPVFGRTIEALQGVLRNENASTAALAEVVLRDAPMTARVLRLANSAFFNPGRQSISTVSRAIVLLGFDPVAELTLSVALIDGLLTGGVRTRVVDEMALCFHAAVQARRAVARYGESHGEEVFIAALLMRVGEMAFWCFGGEAARELDLRLRQPGTRPEDAQDEVLGFRLKQLTIGLAREWRLGPLVSGVLEAGVRSRGPEQAVVLGHRLARAVEGGWESVATRAVLRELADYSREPLEDVQREVADNACEAARVAASFGANEAARRIPQALPVAVPESDAPSAPPPPPPSAPGLPDPQLQLRILRELATLALARAGAAEVLQLTLEGMLRGVGLQRVMLAMLAPNRRQLVGRYGLGAGAGGLAQRFLCLLDEVPPAGDVIGAALARGETAWIAPGRVEPNASLRLRRLVGCEEGFIAPVSAGGQRVGLFYADRAGRPLDEDAWQGFQHFALQACLALGHLGSGRDGGGVAG